MTGVSSASLCYSQRLNMHNTPAAASPKPFDLTSTAFLIVAFLTGIAGALQTPTLSLFLTSEVRVRRWLASSSPGRHHWHPGQPVLAGRSDRKRRSKSLIVFAVCWAFSPACCCLEPQLFHSAVCWGVPEQLRLDRQPADVRPCPRAYRPHRAGSGDVQLDTTRAGVACVGDWPPLAYALAMGFGFTVMYLSAAVAFVVCGAMVWFFLPSMRKGESGDRYFWKHRGVTGATHYCYSLSVR